jgi:predicted metal-dependent hydrolase
MAVEPPVVEIDGITLELRVVRKRVKNVNARLEGSTLRVSAPHGVTSKELDELIHRLGRRLLRRARAAEVNGGEGALRLARTIAARFADPPEIADVRFSTTQQARWGSYSTRTGVVHLNAALRQMPPWVLEAVLAHELTHVVHPDHSQAFWELLRQVCPQTDRARAFLEGVAWLAASWDDLPPVERTQLARSRD